ncbi:Matrix metalloproteise-24 [Daphnia sinensis]|uniref:Matrix metalloproteise-24 n=1 Tax=Daphnia sinensis TaxID=1820382 RepID=A0AAD5PUM0_9CRUS|nr:Matrix metalloproteise-24 [Daphnia sinensis]
MNRLVLTLTSMLTFWLLCSDCAPVLPKPINATRKITHSSTPTTAAVVATTAASITQQTLASQSVVAKPSEPIRPEKLPSSLSQLSRPELLPQSISTESNDRNASSSRNGEGVTVNVIMGFLQKFGYLEGRQDSNSEALFREEAVVNAIKTMQSFGGLSPTGKMDNDTLQLLVTPRCGNKDVELDDNEEHAERRRRKRFVVGGPGWNKRRITYFLANWSPKIGDEETTVKQLERAFKVWSDYAHLKFVQVPTPDADITILFGNGYHGDRYPFDGPGYTLAHAYYPYEFDHFGGDMHFDEDEPWTVDSEEGSGVDFFTVATHELGHSLGLAHSPVPGSVMFPYYKGYKPNLQLDYDDILAMYQLYISRQVHDDRNDGEVTTTTTSTTSTTPMTTTQRTTTTTTKPKPTRASSRTTTPYDEYDDYNEVDNDIDHSGGSGKKTSVGQADEITTTPRTVTINYEGDYDTVDNHRKKLNVTNGDQSSKIPDICQGHFDAVSVLRNELFFFKDQYVWRLGQRAVIDDAYPIHFRHLFRELPEALRKIDALYERPNGHIVFFSGPSYWVFDGDRMIEQNLPISWLGLPDGIDQLDAAFVWGKNKKTYFFRKNLYWRYDDIKRQMDPGYPHDLSRWRGVVSDIDAAMQWTDGRTYFFKDKMFWRFDDTLVRTDMRYPQEATPYWLGCPE